MPPIPRTAGLAESADARPAADRDATTRGRRRPGGGTHSSQIDDGVADPRVAMVSTWNSRCGVAENTRNIVEHAGGSVDFEIFADTDVS